MLNIESHIDENLKEKFIELTEARGKRIQDIYNLHIESDLETYANIYGDDKLIERLKRKRYLSAEIENIFYNFKFVTNVRIDLSINGEILIKFEMDYGDKALIVLPEDTSVNILYTEAYYNNETNVENRGIKKAELMNDLVNKEQRRLLEMNNINKNDIEKLAHYDSIIDKIVNKTVPLSVLQKEFNNYVIKYENYILKIYSPDISDENVFDEHVNEAFVGLFGTNKLRDTIPNFALIYDIIFDKNCPLIYNKSKQYYGLTIKGCTYILYEYIEGKNLTDFLNSTSLNLTEFKLLIKQLIFALYEAYTLIDFTHYDLHTQNIIVKTSEKEITINYPTSGQEIITKYLLVIIDYGSSHIKSNNINYGKIFFDGNVTNESFWMHDIFKILMFTYINLNQILDDNKFYLSKLLSFFTKEDMTIPLHKMYENANPYYAIRKKNKFDNKYFEFSNFISFVKSVD